MQKKFQYIGVILLAHYLLYPFYLDSISNFIQQLFIFGALTLYAIVKKETFIPLFSRFNEGKSFLIVAILFYMLIPVASFFVPLIHGTMDFTYLSSQIRHIFYLLMYFILLAMIRNHKPNCNLRNEFLKLFTLATRNYVIFTILLVVIDPFRNFWISLIHETPRRLELLDMPIYFARIGWAGYSGFSVTFFSTLAVLFSIYLILYTYDFRGRIPKREVVNMFFALIGNAFYGRSGLLVSLILIALGAIYFVFVHKKVKYIFYLIGSILIVFVFLTIIKEFNATLASWYGWMMQPFVSIFESGRIETTSTDALWDMWFVPEPSTLVFGDGFYTSPTSGRYYMGTDVGFIRPILFFGSFFMMAIFVVPAALSIGIGIKSRLNSFFAAMILLTLFIFEVKAEVVFLLIPILIILFIAEFSQQKRHSQVNEIKSHYDNRLNLKGNFE